MRVPGTAGHGDRRVKMNHGAAALFWIATVLVHLAAVPAAHASEIYDECRTRTDRAKRPGFSTVVGLDGKRQVAVDIVVGETLCLAGIEDGPGSLRLVSRAPLSEVVELRLEGDRDGTSLTIRHQNYSREIEYTIGYPARNTKDIIHTQRGSTPPGAPHTYARLGQTTRLILFDFANVPLPARSAADYEPGFLALSFVGAFHFSPVDDLNAEFERNGFSAVSSLQPYLGLGFDARLRGFRPNLDFTGGIHRAGGDRSPNVDQVLIALGLGYAVYRRKGIELFPMLGVTGGDIGVDVRSDDPALAFSGLVGGEQRIRKNVSLLVLSFGADFRHEFWPRQETGLLAGVRAGYGYQFWSGDWVQEEPAGPDLHGGPAVDTSGPFLRLAFGVYVH